MIPFGFGVYEVEKSTVVIGSIIWRAEDYFPKWASLLSPRCELFGIGVVLVHGSGTEWGAYVAGMVVCGGTM